MKKSHFLPSTAVTALLLSATIAAHAIAPLPLPETSRTIFFLEKTEIHEQTFNEVELPDICEYLESLSKAHDPEKKGIKFRISTDLLKELKQSPKTAGFSAFSFINIIDNTCHQFAIGYSIDGDTITFKKKPD